ncbi:MAG: exonuclease subunit SbcD [Nannocystaceae bacterium]
MRILHTSDWHLGLSTGPASRIDEQTWFLDWLFDTLQSREVDVLLVAGDVFDTMHPSAEAQQLYYRFLARVGQAGVRDVVVVGGNHDSPSQLDAPRALLEEVSVHVVGGVPASEERASRMIAPLRARGSDDVAAVCLAVPYVHEYRLGIRTSDLDTEQTRAAFKSAFSELYTRLADHAQEKYPGAPLVATGHLTMGVGVSREDYPQEIHQVGSIEGLPVDLLDPRIRYTALGHIHRCFPIAGSSAWYCGTPIPYSLNEMAVKREVLVVDLGDPLEAEASVQRVEVPPNRELVQLTGDPEKVLADLCALTWTTRLPPLVHVRVETKMAEPGLSRRLYEAVASHRASGGRPELVEVQQRAALVDGENQARSLPSLEGLEPTDVFGLLCDAQQLEGDSRQQLEAVFGEIASADNETFETMVAAIEQPPTAKGEAS